ncbi:unnamed protein product [Darwinula stevensoni]|uniref:Structural maintenance of chromosomes protein n=1 Tax=Darwinula stevensoni TaxID=69355 RepID=A0A7R9A436_9CRUS|nr:unnamed protein product [Darwinula stevensoni]CAG0883478.1 unnamed protein product [Darwinula stevensoni]
MSKMAGATTGESEVHETEESETDEYVMEEEGGIHIGDIYVPPPPPPALTMESTGPRLIISQIVIEDFKSYAGVQTLGPFNKSFSSIIGPNGSGKSNVIDSMLFVFGYRAQKIRSKKISVLIHNSREHPNIDKCTVSVHFKKITDKPDGGIIEVPGSEIVISRTAIKDNSSFYTIGNRRVQRQEVAKVLRSHGIDLDHNRFLILQEPLRLMEERVESLNEQRTSQLNRVKAIEKEKDQLEGPKNSAIKYLKKENDLTQGRNLLYQCHLRDKAKALEGAKKEQKEVENCFANLKEKLDAIAQKKKDKEATLKLIHENFEKATKEMESLKEQFKSLEQEDAKVNDEKKRKNQLRKKLQENIQAEQAKVEQLKKVPEKNIMKIQELEKASESAEEEEAKAEETLNLAMSNLQSDTKPLQEKKAVLETQLIDLKKDVNEAKAAMDMAHSDMDVYQRTERTESARLKQLQDQWQSATQQLQLKTIELDKLKESIPCMEKEFSEGKKELAELTEKEEGLNEEYQGLCLQLEESRSAMQASRNTNRVLDALMQQKRSGNIPGIIGRMGDLGSIDKRWDVAISTACPQLENILVETVNTGEECINFLKTHNIGRATFIALDQMQEYHRYANSTVRLHFSEHISSLAESSIKTPENVPRLFDLVQIKDDRFRPAFYFTLRDTLVAESLDQATRIAYGASRWRVVTLRGDLIEVSGIMSGGGKRASSGRMGCHISSAKTEVAPEQLAAMESRIKHVEKELNHIRNRKEELESNISQLTRDLRSSTAKHKKLQLEVPGLEEQVSRLASQIKEQEKKVAKVAPDPKELKKLEAEVHKSTQDYKKAMEKSSGIDKEVKRLHSKILEVNKSRTKEAQRCLDQAKNQVEKLSKEISRLTVEIQTSQRNLKKSEDKVESLKTEIEELGKALKELVGHQREVEGVASKNIQRSQQLKVLIIPEHKTFIYIQDVHPVLVVEGNPLSILLPLHLPPASVGLAVISCLGPDTAQEEKEELEEGGKKVKKKLDRLTEEENQLRKEKISFDEAMEKVSDTIKEIKTAMNQIKTKLGKLHLEEVEGEETKQLTTFTDQELDDTDRGAIKGKIASLEAELKDQKPNLKVIHEYQNKVGCNNCLRLGVCFLVLLHSNLVLILAIFVDLQMKQYLAKADELQQLTQRRDHLRSRLSDLKISRLNEFMTGFGIISMKLKEIYQMITQGGDAELELVNSLDPFEEGITFSVRPPKKSWKNISNLSGGEKTLSSLALVFALHYYRPTPIYVMDEIDAALDFRNVAIIGEYIQSRTKNAQFIIISLRTQMFELATTLVGIYKTNNSTHCVVMNPREITQMAKALTKPPGQLAGRKRRLDEDPN